jgi:guanylate kinase
VDSRIEKGRQEVEIGRSFAHHEVVNDDLEQAVAEVLGIVEGLRGAAVAPKQPRSNP